jgi:asparagine synthase (glutamine-hydrolysing)
MTSVWPEAEKAELWRERNSFRPTTDLIRHWYEECPSPHPLDQVQQVYCGSWLVEDLLMKADKMSMATSLEVRTPFLDHALVEWASTLPLAWKVGDRRSGYVSKRILRRYAANRVPRAIVERPKQGFPVPANRWLTGELGAWASDRVGHSRQLGELFELGPVRSTVDRARAGDPLAADRTWAMIVLQYWMERWL